MSLCSAAGKILQRGVELDNNKRYTEALVCYQEGIQVLMDLLKSYDNQNEEQKRTYLRDKINEYMKRAELIKEIIAKLKDQGSYSEQINIEDNSKEHSYERIFSRFFDDSIDIIKIEDPYIRSFHQVQNLVRFSELAVRKCVNLKKIDLLTTRDFKENEQERWLMMIKNDLNKHNVSLSIKFSDTLHDRQVILNNGWIIKIGRGLDYFKAPETKFSLGVFDLDYRPCYETIVNIFHTKNVKINM